MSLKYLVEQAQRVCEMRWKILVFDPSKDNKMVEEIKDFDDITIAFDKKRQLLQKYPNHIIEIIAENRSTKNESIRIKTTFGSGKKGVDASYVKAADAVDVVRRTIKDNTEKGTKMTITVESAQKNETQPDTSKYRVYSHDTKDGWDLLGHYSTEYDAMKVFDAWKLRLSRGGGRYGVYTDVKLFKPGEKAKFESFRKNESLNLDSLTDEDAKQLIVHLQDFIKDKSSKYYHIDKIETILKKKYKAESIKKEDIDDDSTGIIKNDDGKTMTEARGWRVSIKLQSKDNMNNINVEDAIEDALNAAGFTVNDVDAERM